MKVRPQCDARREDGRRCPDTAGFRVAHAAALHGQIALGGPLPLNPGKFCEKHSKGQPRVALEVLERKLGATG